MTLAFSEVRNGDPSSTRRAVAVVLLACRGRARNCRLPRAAPGTRRCGEGVPAPRSAAPAPDADSSMEVWFYPPDLPLPDAEFVRLEVGQDPNTAPRKQAAFLPRVQATSAVAGW